jgi:hypothetical protein
LDTARRPFFADGLLVYCSMLASLGLGQHKDAALGAVVVTLLVVICAQPIGIWRYALIAGAIAFVLLRWYRDEARYYRLALLAMGGVLGITWFPTVQATLQAEATSTAVDHADGDTWWGRFSGSFDSGSPSGLLGLSLVVAAMFFGVLDMVERTRPSLQKLIEKLVRPDYSPGDVKRVQEEMQSSEEFSEEEASILKNIARSFLKHGGKDTQPFHELEEWFERDDEE